MNFAELVKAALELGVIPALALFLVAAMFLQNRQLLKDRQRMENKLLTILSEVVLKSQMGGAAPPPQLPPAPSPDASSRTSGPEGTSR